jgi:hypothetical protein
MSSRYQYSKIIKNSEGKRYYSNTVYPEIQPTLDDIYIITTINDRLDVIAYDYYGDSTLYWIIAVANNIPGDSLIPEPGSQIRIPRDIQSIINDYTNLNTNR